ncbi:zinc dependent phospholipase C family protein [Sphingobacterium bovistauri]|uniref:S1/P1 Nuclease n=1 Tax=Sphingobacterium bovistauri TaxID=2781959 RepID=A0ABS7Z218_9SPHI|nr:zinc dependent phospholipase C family protein [Sphingobacterium bovistauri]MCA5003632.1 hypothetical protein [Sphingobacterium bovistauri]
MKPFPFILIIIGILLSSWGFNPHKKINETAVFLLPKELAIFYKKNIKTITEKAVDADKRCYIDTIEGPKHYIDLDKYENVDSIPIHWSKAKEKLTEKKLLAQGIVPWQINRTYMNLVEAFKIKNLRRIIQYSADLGHYVADAHVPLHTTSNYNGQYSNQIGIHALWETRIPEMYMKKYDLFIGSAVYISDPVDYAWKIVKQSNSLVDSVLHIEKQLSMKFKSSAIKTYIERNNQLIQTYSDSYTEAYDIAMNGMVERRFKASIHAVASFWYSAWIDAGQPNLNNVNFNFSEERIEINVDSKKSLGREEWHE